MKKTEKQNEAINANSAHVLVRGVPGSGKTVVLVEKVKQILETASEAKILFITFNHTLKSYLEMQLQGVSYNHAQFSLTTYHVWAKEVLNQVITLGKNDFRYIDNIFYKMYREHESKSRYFTDKTYESFVKEEWEWMKGKAITNVDEYVKVARTGRSIALSPSARKELYAFFEQVEGVILSRNLVPHANYGMLVMRHAEAIREVYGYTHVFVDEAQDLTQAEMTSLSRIVGEDGQLVIAADLGQKIYKTDFTWKSAEVNIQGGRTKTLDIAHRSTKQIMDLAASLLAHDPLVKTEEEGRPQKVVREGSLPLVVKVKNEKKAVIELMKAIMEADTDARIGILCYSNAAADNFVKVLEKQNIPSVKIDRNGGDMQSSGAKLMTMHGAKGLEFDGVIITGLNERFPSFYKVLEDDKEEHINSSRRLLYVSMTRARKDLYLLCNGDSSQFINELNEKYYEKMDI